MVRLGTSRWWCAHTHIYTYIMVYPSIHKNSSRKCARVLPHRPAGLRRGRHDDVRRQAGQHRVRSKDERLAFSLCLALYSKSARACMRVLCLPQVSARHLLLGLRCLPSSRRRLGLRQQYVFVCITLHFMYFVNIKPTMSTQIHFLLYVQTADNQGFSMCQATSLHNPLRSFAGLFRR